MQITSIQNFNTALNNENLTFRANTNSLLNKTCEGATDVLAKGIGKIIDTNTVQKYANKFKNSENFATHISSATGILLSAFFILSTAKSKIIEEERKKPLMLNTAISCAIATTGGYTIDKMLKKPLDKFVEGFKAANKDNPKLYKYIDGIKIAKSALIFGMLYRFIVPVISMFLAEKVIENKEKKLNKTA